MISTFTINGIFVSSAVISHFPFPGSISCIAVSADGEYALIGTSSSANQQNYKPDFQAVYSSVVEKPKKRIATPVPSICFLNLHTLEVQENILFECTFFFLSNVLKFLSIFLY